MHSQVALNCFNCFSALQSDSDSDIDEDLESESDSDTDSDSDEHKKEDSRKAFLCSPPKSSTCAASSTNSCGFCKATPTSLTSRKTGCAFGMSGLMRMGISGPCTAINGGLGPTRVAATRTRLLSLSIALKTTRTAAVMWSVLGTPLLLRRWRCPPAIACSNSMCRMAG